MDFPNYILEDHDSAYVQAAQEDTVANRAIILQNIADPALRTNDAEHNDALKRAVGANNITAVRLILNQANLKTEDAIYPFGSTDDDSDELSAAVINTALKYASANLIMLLIRQQPIQNYLRTISRNDYTFRLLKSMLANKINLRAGCEIVQIASMGQAILLPRFLLELHSDLLEDEELTSPPPLRRISAKPVFAHEPDFDSVVQSIETQRRHMLHGFKQVTKALEDGFTYYIDDSNTNEKKRVPALPAYLIHLIFNIAISDSDYATSPISKAQILGIALRRS